MMRTGSVMAMTAATLLICCCVNSHQEQDVSMSDHSRNSYENDYRQKEAFENFLKFLLQYELAEDKNGVSTSFGRNFHDQGRTAGLRSSLRNSDYANGNYERPEYKRFVDALGGGNFVRNLDALGGGNFVRNLDSLGGNNLVKKNLDQIGGPNLVKRTLDALGGGNLVRNLDELGGSNFVRQVDPLGGGHNARILSPLDDGQLVRQVREAHRISYPQAKRYEYASLIGGKRYSWPFVSPIEFGYYGEGLPKRNFDEIDRSNLDSFVKKRNFDEIDQTSMPFPFKRFYHMYGLNDIESPVASNFNKKRYRPDYPMDEIDLSQFPIGSKRSSESFLNNHPLR